MPAMALPAQDKARLTVRSARPEDFEMPLEGFATWITPVDRFFVRTHLYNPAVDTAAWRLEVRGLVGAPLTLDLAALKALPRVELAGVLECAGNGRSFYQPGIPGMQWKYGAVGNARWAGARLADVLKKAGVKTGAVEVLFDGADVPIGTMPDFRRSLPLAKALHPDTLLAYEMNGAPLTPSHGFPLRLVAPGWAGDSWVKWVTGIEVLDREYDGFFMKGAYRYPVRPVAPGTALDPAADMRPVTALRPKSVIASPVEGEALPSGPVTIRGAAWSGEHPVAKVEVSADSGRTWKPARLGAERAPYAWRLWESEWTPPGAASYVLMARATDARGETQPFVQDWNPSGYLWNVVPQVRVEAGSAKPGRPPETASAIPEFPPQAKSACLGCHGTDMIAGQRLTRAQWERELDKMGRWGAVVKPEDRSGLLDFLVRSFGR